MDAATIVITVFSAVVFLVAAAMKLTAQPRSIDTRDRLGVTPDRWRLIAALEIAGAIGVLVGLAFRPLGVAAACGLVALSVGALGAHLVRLRDPFGEAAAALVALVLSVATLALQLITA